MTVEIAKNISTKHIQIKYTILFIKVTYTSPPISVQFKGCGFD